MVGKVRINGDVGSILCLSGAWFTGFHAEIKGAVDTAAWAGYWLDYH